MKSSSKPPITRNTSPTCRQTGVEDVLWAYRDRILDLKKDLRLRYILIFKNQGATAGATLEHSHSQLIALPVVPTSVLEEIDGCRQHFQQKERCIYCDILRQESTEGTRVVLENPEFVCLTPYAPRFPFEMWILPKRHAGYFEECQRTQFEFLAPMLGEALRRMDAVLARPAYNFILHSSPLHEKTGDYYHWHIEIIPNSPRWPDLNGAPDFTSTRSPRKKRRRPCATRKSSTPPERLREIARRHRIRSVPHVPPGERYFKNNVLDKSPVTREFCPVSFLAIRKYDKV
jgi:galactose-1-phosphate uridylyltransferase